MLDIDGGAGGGQVVRTAVTLAALSGQAVTVDDVRGDRSTPGMRPQHVAAVEAAAALCSATVEGATTGAETLVFDPGPLRADDVAVDVGTAASIPLMFDAVLPLATALAEPATVTATGGTDVEWSPPMDYLRRVKLPLLSVAGLEADLSVDRRGFYPVGDGEATLSLRPSSVDGLDVTDRGDLRRVEVRSVAAADLADAEVAERQAAAAADGLGVDAPVDADATYEETACPGSVVTLLAVCDRSRAGFSALEEPGTPAEAVAAAAVEDFERFYAGPAAVDRHLADQLQVPLALGGGRVTAPAVTGHLETNREVLESFGYDATVEARGDRVVVSG